MFKKHNWSVLGRGVSLFSGRFFSLIHFFLTNGDSSCFQDCIDSSSWKYSPKLLVVAILLLRFLLLAHPEHLQRIGASRPHLYFCLSSLAFYHTNCFRLIISSTAFNFQASPSIFKASAPLDPIFSSQAFCHYWHLTGIAFIGLIITIFCGSFWSISAEWYQWIKDLA